MTESPPPTFDDCPKCGERFRPFLRGLVGRRSRKWWFFGPRRPSLALICWACKEIVGWEW